MKKDWTKYQAFVIGPAITYAMILFMEYIDLIRVPSGAWISNTLGFLFYAFFISLAIHKYLAKGGSLIRVGAGFGILAIVIFSIGYFTSNLQDNPLMILLMISFWLMLFYFILPEFFQKYRWLIVGLYGGSALFFLYARLFTGSFELYESTYKVWALSLFLLPVPVLLTLWFYEQWKWFRTLKAEKAKAELALLRSQVNPHFFFNTLNNLYSLVVHQSDKAPDVILKLSDMMRYTIYEGKKDRVPLKEEIEYLQRYIDLHKIRYQKEVVIKFEKPEETEATIAPLLLILPLENAFKHGVETMREGAFIHASVFEDDKKIVFRISNNFDEQTEETEKGIGLENLKKRLELLYPDQHKLEIEKEEGVFTVILELYES
ncbi:sensor histidine kinase [Gracilimonas sediminicola]|uniref:Histidine kinase n=1 Tax=Gracilimonas sediminicola TaxID=2952158 RepID=A0A9X2RD11_9BACT|nr:histidine kinase [Gracilimonas sediminicola]MCP9290262.1 histidine kinase [Gracilimonas sediminicola]